jgi:hypothetical protein
MIFLRGKELQSMYRPCYYDAQASAGRTPVRVIAVPVSMPGASR